MTLPRPNLFKLVAVAAAFAASLGAFALLARHDGLSAPRGSAAEIDLTSGTGEARSELTLSDQQPTSDKPSLRIHGRTGSGAAVVSPATS